MRYRKLLQLAVFFVIGLFSIANTTHAQITAIGQCTGATENQTYNIFVDGLNPLAEVSIYVNDSVVQGPLIPLPIPLPSGLTDHTTGNFDFVDGTQSLVVRIIESTQIVNPAFPPLPPLITIRDTTIIVVHEVLCTDIDNDDEFDFNKAGCDYTKPVGINGAIVSTAAPYADSNVYLYVLVGGDSLYTAAEDQSNYSGLFEDLPNGDYKVFAYNFLDTAEANNFINNVPDGSNLSAYTTGGPTCTALCGIGSYTLDCQSIVDIYVDPSDYEVCMEGDAEFYVQDSFLITPPSGSSVTYQWQYNDGSTWQDTADVSAPDSVLNLTNVMFADSGNLYRVIVTMVNNGTTISMDTSESAVLTVYDDPVLLAGLDTIINSNDLTGIILDVNGTSVAADSFELVSIDVNGLTPGGGNATTGITADSSYISMDTYTNNTGAMDTAFYTIVPISEHGCRGPAVIIYVAVRPCPMVDDLAAVTICSGDIAGITLPSTDNNGISIDSFNVVAVVPGTISGTASTGITTMTNYIFNDSYTNVTNGVDSVVYTITAFANDCESGSFTATVKVNPEPVLFASTDTVCSETAIGIVLTEVGTSVAADSFMIVSINSNGMSPSAGSPVVTTTTDENEIADDAWTNTSDTSAKVTYTIIPITNDCSGEAVEIVVTVDPEVVIEAGADQTICSNSTVDLTVLGASISGGASDGVWSSPTSGVFATDSTFANATSYTPSDDDKNAGFVILTLTSDEPTGACSAQSDSVRIEILDIRCSDFPWSGND